MTLALQRADPASPARSVHHFTGYSATSPSEVGILLTNRCTRMDGSLPWMLFLHGLGTSAEGAIGLTKTVSVIAARGIPCFIIDAGGNPGNTYGPLTSDDPIQTKIPEAVAYARANFGVSPGKFIIAGNSQGSAQALIYAADHPADILAVPVTLVAADLEDIRANNRSGLQATIETAYGGNTNWQAKRPTRNPIERAANAWNGIPVKGWYSTTDTTVVPAVPVAFAARTGIPMDPFDGPGHTTVDLDGEIVADWLMGAIAA